MDEWAGKYGEYPFNQHQSMYSHHSSVGLPGMVFMSSWEYDIATVRRAAFQLKTFRPNLRIIDRSHMQAIISEQRFQVGGLVSEDSAARTGQMLGVDSVLIYWIEGPTLHDRFFARQHRDLPPVTITSKIIRVDSGEVVYHNESLRM